MEMDDSISDGNEDWGRRRKREYAIDRASYHMYSISARSGLSWTREYLVDPQALSGVTASIVQSDAAGSAKSAGIAAAPACWVV